MRPEGPLACGRSAWARIAVQRPRLQTGKGLKAHERRNGERVGAYSRREGRHAGAFLRSVERGDVHFVRA